MLNQDKIRMMSRCAMYEKAKGKEDLEINRYFQGDYIRLNTLKTLIGVTIGFLFCVGLYVVVHADYYIQHLFKMNLMELAKELGIIYAIVLIAFALISIVFYGWKYMDAQKRVKSYYEDLKILEEMSDMEGER